MMSQIGYVVSNQVLIMFYVTRHAMLQKIGGASTLLYCWSYLCSIMHYRNTNSDASVAMASLII